MVSFKERSLSINQTLGEKLKEARESENISLEEAARATRIQKKYLDLLERGLYKKLPGEVYIRSFLKTYATFLELNPATVLNFYNKERLLYQKITPTKRFSVISKVFRMPRSFITPKLIKTTLIGLVIFAILLYLGLEIEKIVAPPFLFVENPEDNLIISEQSIEVSGKTERESKITINGQEILSDKDGYFQEIVDLQEGLNIIKVSAFRKHSQENTIYRKIMVVRNEQAI